MEIGLFVGASLILIVLVLVRRAVPVFRNFSSAQVVALSLLFYASILGFGVCKCYDLFCVAQSKTFLKGVGAAAECVAAYFGILALGSVVFNLASSEIVLINLKKLVSVYSGYLVGKRCAIDEEVSVDERNKIYDRFKNLVELFRKTAGERFAAVLKPGDYEVVRDEVEVFGRSDLISVIVRTKDGVLIPLESVPTIRSKVVVSVRATTEKFDGVPVYWIEKISCSREPAVLSLFGTLFEIVAWVQILFSFGICSGTFVSAEGGARVIGLAAVGIVLGIVYLTTKSYKVKDLGLYPSNMSLASVELCEDIEEFEVLNRPMRRTHEWLPYVTWLALAWANVAILAHLAVALYFV